MSARVASRVLWCLLFWSAPARGQIPPGHAPEASAPPAPAVAAAARLPEGFYRDERARVMQVSFDLARRLWLGAAYAPRQRPSGRQELAPAAFDFGLLQEVNARDGRTRHRMAILEGEARLNPFGLDVTAFRYDLSHAYGWPLVRITTLWAQPARHDLYLNVGLYTEAGRLQIEPLGEAGNHQLTLATAQATLDLWQSWDLRSYVRLRVGPVAHVRLGPWHDEARTLMSLPETALEGSLMLGGRQLQQLKFRLRGEWLRGMAWPPVSLARDWLVDAEASWEIILIAINDQPLSLRLAARGGSHDPDVRAPATAAPDGAGRRPWDLAWGATAGVRISFFSPPIPRTLRR
jgi:hypothetical protein